MWEHVIDMRFALNEIRKIKDIKWHFIVIFAVTNLDKCFIRMNLDKCFIIKISYKTTI